MKQRHELHRMAVAAGILLALTSGKAAAYIGPGGGLSLLSTALAMLAAFSVSAMVVLAWPIRTVRRWLRQRREKRQADASDTGQKR